MITEDYVSFETAKLLKEKGFDGASRRMFRTLKGYPAKFYDLPNWTTNIDLNDTCQNCEFAIIPTLQMATKWLREVHHIFISISFQYDKFNYPHYFYKIANIGKKEDWNIEKSEHITVEEATEAAIKYCLENLI